MRKIIIPSVGFGKRFLDIGLNQAKYKIIANDKPLFYWSLISLKKFFDHEFIFIFRKDNYDKDFIEKWLEILKIKNYKVILLDEPTDGQASSVYKSEKYINDDDSVLIYNIDTYIIPDSLNDQILSNDGCIVTTKVPGERWSFAKLGEDNFVKEVSEKIKISDNASVGLYYFKKWEDFKKVYLNKKDEVIKKYKESYICPMYQYLIDEYSKKISIFEIETKNFICLGTPEEIEEFDPNWIEKNS